MTASMAEPATAAVASVEPIAKVYGQPFLQMPHDLYIPPEALEVFLDQFEGPLDLLLYLIRKENISVLDIPMAKLTVQYLEYVEMMRTGQLELAAQRLTEMPQAGRDYSLVHVLFERDAAERLPDVSPDDLKLAWLTLL